MGGPCWSKPWWDLSTEAAQADLEMPAAPGAPGTSGPSSVHSADSEALERDCWQRWIDLRDETARRQLLTRHIPYARVIAALTFSQRKGDDVGFDDYLQFARVGLLEAFERFDPSMGASFRTFAAPRMRGAVLDGLARLTERGRQREVHRQLRNERVASVASADEDVSNEPRPLGSDDLFRRLAEVGIGLALSYMLEDSAMFSGSHNLASGPNPVYASVELRQLVQRVRSLVERLPGQERTVIQCHYLHGHPFERIASDMLLSRGRISQIHKKALQSLRNLMGIGPPIDKSV